MDLKITISGGEGAGKTLLLNRFATLLKAEGHEVVCRDEDEPVEPDTRVFPMSPRTIEIRTKLL